MGKAIRGVLLFNSFLVFLYTFLAPHCEIVCNYLLIRVIFTFILELISIGV